MQMKARDTKPNNLEKKATEFFNEIQPGEWSYVGDGKFIVGTKNPDFIGLRDKKKLIEIFGTWYHSAEFAKRNNFRHVSPEDRVGYFKKFGFDTLIVWEREFKDLENLK
jgi:hypothetical protein